MPQRKSRLGKWISRQREEYRVNALSEDRIRKLMKIDFCWDQKEEEWRKNYDSLLLHIVDVGHCPYKVDDPKLNGWMETQRKFRREGRIVNYRLRLLNEIRFIWSHWEHTWNMNYIQLVAFYQENGHSNVPRKSGSLGRWVAKQRENEDKLSYLQKTQLNVVNFKWRNSRCDEN